MDSHQGSHAVVRKIPEPPGETSLRLAWRAWGDGLRRRHLDGLAAFLLDAGRPLGIVSAQLLYVGRPVLGESAGQIAELLESEDERMDFIAYLREQPARNPGASEGDT